MAVPILINNAFEEAFSSKKTYLELMGGRGSGKSFFIAKQFLMMKAVHYPGIKIMGMRKVATTLRLSVWPALMDGVFLSRQRVTINKTDKEIHFSNGSLIACSGADDPEKLKSLEGFDIVWKEEATEFTEADHLNIDAAIKSKRKQIIDTYNPIPLTPNFSNYLKATFWDKVNPDALCIKTTYRDNIDFLPAKYIASLEALKETNPALWDMWANGNYVTLEGVIFDNFDIVDTIPTEGGVKFLGYGLDFGFSDDPAALIGVYRAGEDIWLDEKLFETGLTNQDLGAAFKRLKIDKNTEIIADSSEPKSIEEIFRQGFNIKPATKGPDSIRAGISAMRACRIHILRGSTNLIGEFSTYSWKKNRDGRPLPEPMDSYNHGIDAARYRIFTAPEKKVVFL